MCEGEKEKKKKEEDKKEEKIKLIQIIMPCEWKVIYFNTER